jgi:catechol 2,3-dioxygenase-like lactoylglutathione lyase family enzyme
MNQRLAHVAIVVTDYDEAIDYYCDVLGFELVEDEPRGGGKRWVLVRPPGSPTSLLLARAANDRQRSAIGNQFGGRVGFFLHTDDFARDYAAYSQRGVQFVEQPRNESYGKVVVFEDRYGNRWDLIEYAGTA